LTVEEPHHERAFETAHDLQFGELKNMTGINIITSLEINYLDVFGSPSAK
jgi:hypothetical protein